MKNSIRTLGITIILLLAILTSASADNRFSPENTINAFNSNLDRFFKALSMSQSEVEASKELCWVVENKESVKKYGIPAYTSIDNHVLIVADDFIFSYTDLTDASTLKNIPQMALSASFYQSYFDDSMNMIEWMNGDESIPFKGTGLDAYMYCEPYTYKVYLIVNHNQKIDNLSFSLEKLLIIANDLLYPDTSLTYSEKNIPTPTSTNTFDLSSMTSEELRSLQVSIIDELGKRKDTPSFTAPINTYEAGKDFPVGKYKITATGSYTNTYITIYDSKALFNAGKPTVRETTLFSHNGDSIVFDFKSGMIVEVGHSPARFEPFNGLVWE